MTAAMKLPRLQARVNVPPPNQRSEDQAADEGADDADDDIAQPTLPGVVAGNHARHPTSERSENDPGDDPEATVDVHHCPPDSPAGRPGVPLV